MSSHSNADLAGHVEAARLLLERAAERAKARGCADAAAFLRQANNLARRASAELNSEPQPRTYREVLAAVADEHSVDTAALLGKKRVQHLNTARGELARRLHDELGWTYERIGTAMNGRHHTTVLHLAAKARQRLDG